MPTFRSPSRPRYARAYRELARRCKTPVLAVAVRSSATAEDLPQASFAGQQETFLNVSGESELLRACRKCYASLFTDRAIVYRENNGFDHLQVALSIGIQKMVRADRAGSGVMFTLDTETGFPGVVVINAAWGLGENVVQGTVNPDKYVIFKRFLAGGRYTPIIEKSLGAKEKKLIYGEGGGAATHNIKTPRAERDAIRPARCRDRATRPMGGGGRIPLRAAHGHRVGQGRRQRGTLPRPSAAGDRAIRQVELAPQDLQSVENKHGSRDGSGHRRGDFHRRGLHHSQRGGHRSLPRGCDPRDRIHRSGLGADHEKSGRPDHQLRGHDEPRSDREPRTRPAGHRRHVECH